DDLPQSAPPRGPEARGSEARGSETRGSETRASEARGPEARASESRAAQAGAPEAGAVPDPASLRRIPRTDQLLGDPRMRAAERRVGRDLVKAAITRAQDRARNAEITPDQVAEAAAAELPVTAASLTEVINATGVLVHTNLGRAPLSRAAR